MADPLHQFEIKTIVPIQIGGLDVSFTNSSLWMMIAVGCIYWLLMAGTRQHALVPGRLQSVVEMAYEFVGDLIRENAGKEGMKYFPLIFSLFMFVLMGNMMGMLPVPFGFTFTSHIIVTFTLAMLVFLAVTALGFYLHGAHYLSLFAPAGAPKAILPVLVPIEILSYLIRPISLSVRLFCNMMAGHTMMKVFAGFVISLFSYYAIPAIAPLAISVLMTGFEFAVALIQAYIFTVLTCFYLHDAIHLH